MKTELKDFIFYAKKKGYADDNSIWEKTEDGGKTITIKKGNYTYTDTYFGNLVDCGQEKILYRGEVVWAMSYRGGCLEEELAKEAFTFLRKCIIKMPKDFPARGPKKYQSKEWKYENIWNGDINGFTGEENVYFRNKKICFRNYLGGLVKNKK